MQLSWPLLMSETLQSFACFSSVTQSSTRRVFTTAWWFHKPLATSSPPYWHVSTRENQGSNFKYSTLLADA
ncbi:hypothetical protein BKA70DRAFT_1569463 [Coprinopsis sp. MPI-PUGE-AT-0042]|nr:hypothetical protein BKA70DRAFT_1569463 [Coprinopsis sp. MPI-PUGE-AT-0042]